MVQISRNLVIPDDELEFKAIRAQGAGGQNVNKVSSAIHLRFDITHSSLPEPYRTKLLLLRDQRINKDGVLVIKAQEHRTREKNQQAAIERLVELVKSVMSEQKKRKATRPTRAAKKRRMDAKTRRAKIKSNRGRVDY
ncbi:MAG: aminoacyl-tRNA hydrolase [Gammaproteobacteria bacterium]|nr:aminoacyl-tRNA hydrolase [Gammaproteobacteria bacterium]